MSMTMIVHMYTTVRCGADVVVLIGYWNGMVGSGECAPVQACAPFHVVQVHKLSTDRD